MARPKGTGVRWSSRYLRHLLEGRQIVKVEANAYYDGDDVHMQPVLTLDNGLRVKFQVQEANDGSEYGVNPLVIERDGSYWTPR